MPTVTIGERLFRIRAVARGEGWQAHAVRAESGHRFGVDVTAATEAEAVAAVERWLAWQHDHAAALDDLQQAERAYHRVLTAHAFGGARRAEASVAKRHALEQMESARSRLDETRQRQPGQK